MTGPRVFDDELTFVEPVSATAGSTAVVVTDMQLSNTSAEHGVNRALDRVAPGSADHLVARVREVVLPALTRLLEGARALRVPIVYLTLGAAHRDLSDMTLRTGRFVQRLEQASGVADILWTGDPGYQICPEIAPRPEDLVVRKTGWGAFNSSGIDQALRDRGIRTLLMTGVTTNCCVETTARDAADRGYAVAVVDECTADFDREAHEAALRAFRFNFGAVLSTADQATRFLESAAEVER